MPRTRPTVQRRAPEDILKRFRPLFHPRGVVVAGASSHPGKFGFVSLHNLRRFGYQGAIFPVNREGAEILGQPTYRTVEEIPPNKGRPRLCVHACCGQRRTAAFLCQDWCAGRLCRQWRLSGGRRGGPPPGKRTGRNRRGAWPAAGWAERPRGDLDAGIDVCPNCSAVSSGGSPVRCKSERETCCPPS